MEPFRFRPIKDALNKLKAKYQKGTSSPVSPSEPTSPLNEVIEDPTPLEAKVLEPIQYIEPMGFFVGQPSVDALREDTSHVEEEAVPVDQYIVSADDTDSEFIAAHVNVLFDEDTERTHHLESATGTISLLEKAMWGNKNGKDSEQAQVVLLDNNYEPPRYHRYGDSPQDPWENNREEIYKLAEKHGINFSKYRFNREFQQVNILYYRGSLGKALLLRAFGYIGKIIIVSNSPPLAENLIGHVNNIREGIPDFPEGMPVQGITFKEPTHYRAQSVMQYSDEVTPDGRWVGKEIENGELADALRVLI